MSVATSGESSRLPSKLRVEKATVGGVDYVRFQGIIDQSFHGGKLAAVLPSPRLIVDLRETRRISSSGIRPWGEFLASRGDGEVYLVECSPHLISQFNMLSSLQGKAKVLSFYAPYRCHGGSHAFEVRFVLPRDRAAIRDLTPPQHACSKCGGVSDLDDDAATFLRGVAAQAAFDVDHEVAAFLRSRFKYELVAGANRLRVERWARGRRLTYLRVSGHVDRAFPADALARSVAGTAVLDVSGATVVDQAGATQWRSFVRAALPFVDSLYLHQCPAGFLEQTLLPEDVEETIRVLSFQVPYACARCAAGVTRVMDVEAQHANLRAGAFPEVTCEGCGAVMTPRPSEDLHVLLRILPRLATPPAVRRFIKRAAARPSDRLDDALRAPAKTRPRRLMTGAVAGTAVVALVVALFALRSSHQRPVAPPPGAVVAPARAAEPPEGPKAERPSWIISDAPASAHCQDVVNLIMCVGVSSYQTKRDDGVAEASDAALEELANLIALRATDARFQAVVPARYGDARTNGLAALETIVDRDGGEYAKALEAARAARKRVAAALRRSGGVAVPVRHADWYWEEYAAKAGGKGTEFLVFVRFDVTLDMLRSLVQRYSTPVDVLGAPAIPYFPSLAWRDREGSTGALLLGVPPALARLGVARSDVVTAVGGEAVEDAADLARRLARLPRREGATLAVRASGGPLRSVAWKAE